MKSARVSSLDREDREGFELKTARVSSLGPLAWGAAGAASGPLGSAAAVIDLALSPPSSGGGWAILHRADCPQVRQLAADGVPVLTMLGCERMPPADNARLIWHTCLGPPGASGRP
jgi:hypothetical protein